jgi:hypothetical protein
MSFPRVVLWLATANFVVAGAFALLFPATNASLIQLEPGGVTAFSDLRAVYGGLRLGIGCFLAWAAVTRALRVGLLLTATLFAGNILGRVVSLAADGVPAPAALGLLAFEMVALGVAGLAAARSRQPAA